MPVKAGIQFYFVLVSYCLLFFEVACFAPSASYFLCLCKESNQRKHTPVVALRCAKSPALLALTGLHRQAIHGLAMKASASASPAAEQRQFPAKTAMLGATKGEVKSKATFVFQIEKARSIASSLRESGKSVGVTSFPDEEIYRGACACVELRCKRGFALPVPFGKPSIAALTGNCRAPRGRGRMPKP